MILVIGDAMIDRYWFGTVTRVAQDAPIPILKKTREEDRPGAAAHVARTIEAMGGRVRGVFSESYASDPIVKIRLIARTQQIGRVDLDTPQAPIKPERIEAALEGCGTVVISDYAKGSIGDPQEVVALCKGRGAKVLVDTKRADAACYKRADVIKPNHFEMQEMVGPWESERELEQNARTRCELYGIGAILMTRGPIGMSLFTEEWSYHIGGRHLELCDVSGAGDAAIAALAVALDRGMDIRLAASYANKAAGVAISRFGTALVSEQEVFQ